MSIRKNKINKNIFFMNLAFMQAQKNLGNTKQNPSVGCVIVKKNNVISAGSTSIYGRPHAEFNAIKHSKYNIKNSQLYSTLEPCSHHGKTPPCVNLIVKNRIKKVFFSIKDPDPRSYNQSKKILQKNKITTNCKILNLKGNLFYVSYIRCRKQSLPFVTAKIAVSKDLFTNNKKNKWITNQYSRGRVHLMRSCHDCIITSSNTIIKDNPRLNCRIDGLKNRSPSIIILDKKLETPINSKIIKNSKPYNTIIFFYNKNKKKIEYLKKLKIKLIEMPLSNKGNFDLEKVLLQIKLLGYSRIFLESGISLIGNFLKGALINNLYIFKSSRKLGKNGSKSMKSYMNLINKNKKNQEKVNLFGDKLLKYRFNNV